MIQYTVKKITDNWFTISILLSAIMLVAGAWQISMVFLMISSAYYFSRNNIHVNSKPESHTTSNDNDINEKTDEKKVAVKSDLTDDEERISMALQSMFVRAAEAHSTPPKKTSGVRPKIAEPLPQEYDDFNIRTQIFMSAEMKKKIIANGYSEISISRIPYNLFNK